MAKKQQRKRSRQAARRSSEARKELERARRVSRAHRQARQRTRADAALAAYESAEQRFAKLDLHSDLKQAVLASGAKLIDARFQFGLQVLSSATWVRPVAEWKPRGKSPVSRFKSLVKHLLVKYTMPEFLYKVFFESDEGLRDCGVALFLHLGQGGSLYKLVKSGAFPVPLTKRMCHLFMSSPLKFEFLEAVRHAQVTVHGGDRRVTSAIVGSRELGRGFKPNEEFWDTVVQWTCGQPMLAPSQLAPIYDWVAHQRAQQPGFSMKGRTGLSVLRSMEEWHGELARERKIQGHRYSPSGFEARYSERKVPKPTGGHRLERHSITEVLSSKALASEGRALNHCVYSYSWSIQRGQVSIWSYRLDDERQLTIEVQNSTSRVVQCRGKNNRLPLSSEVAQVRRWMQENNLVAASGLPGF